MVFYCNQSIIIYKKQNNNSIMLKIINLQRTIKWLGKTEGRDKFCKLLQYGSRILKDFAESRRNYELGIKCQGLSIGLRNARKIFRLLKSIYEYDNVVQLLWQKIPLIDKAIMILSKIFYLLYWIFDNIAILSLVRLWRFDGPKYIKLGFIFWFLGLVTYLVAAVKSLIQTSIRIKKNSLRLIKQEKHQKDQQLVAKRRELILMIIKTIGDLIPSSQGAGIFVKIFGVEASDGLVGWGGFVSALISNYQLYE